MHGVVDRHSKKNQKRWKRLQKSHLVPLLKSQMKKERQGKISLYLYDLFTHFCDAKTDFIDLSCIAEETQFMCNERSTKTHQVADTKIRLIFQRLRQYRNGKDAGLI